MFERLKKEISSPLKSIGRKVKEKELSSSDLEEPLEKLKLSLLQSDVSLKTSEKLCKLLEKKLQGKRIPRRGQDEFIKESFKKSVVELLSKPRYFSLPELIKSSEKPFLIVGLGFNGTGKTLSLAKLGKLLKDKGYSVVFAAADTYREAAIEQLEEYTKGFDVKTIKHERGADAAAVVYDAREHAEAKQLDVVLADTAGRSHANINLMDELKKICRVNEPDLKLLVVDSLTGNDALEQAKKFDNTVGVNANILTKMDVNPRGGAALSITEQTNKPILYIGTGQNLNDLERFKPKEIAAKILKQF